MPRNYEIKHAFMNAIKRDPSLGVIVTTQEFVHQLEKLNWHCSLREANQWIKANTVMFRDASTQGVKLKPTSSSTRMEGCRVGFPSPAADFVEKHIDLNPILVPSPAIVIRIETAKKFVLGDYSLKVLLGDTAVFQFGDYTKLSKMFSSRIINFEVETIDGEGLGGRGLVIFES